MFRKRTLVRMASIQFVSRIALVGVVSQASGQRQIAKWDNDVLEREYDALTARVQADLPGYGAPHACLAAPGEGWTAPDCEAFDSDANGGVDLADFAAFSRHFMQDTGCFHLASAARQAGVSLIVNRNAGAQFPQIVLMGARDPNVVVVEGWPGAGFAIHVCEYQSGYGGVLAEGMLDGHGRAQVRIEPGLLVEGEVLHLQADLWDLAGIEPDRVIRAVRAELVDMMASRVALNMPIRSIANIRGPVMGLTDDTVIVGSITYGVTGETVYANFVSLADLQLGDWIVLDGEFGSADRFTAYEIGLEDAEPLVRLAGRVQGVGPAGVTLLGVSVFLSSDTTYHDHLRRHQAGHCHRGARAHGYRLSECHRGAARRPHGAGARTRAGKRRSAIAATAFLFVRPADVVIPEVSDFPAKLRHLLGRASLRSWIPGGKAPNNRAPTNKIRLGSLRENQ